MKNRKFGIKSRVGIVVMGPWVQLQRLETGMIPKQETITMFLTVLSEFLRA